MWAVETRAAAVVPCVAAVMTCIDCSIMKVAAVVTGEAGVVMCGGRCNRSGGR